MRASSVDESIAAALARLRLAIDARLRQLGPADGEDDALDGAVRAALSSAGKRLRPALVALIAEAFGGDRDAAIDLGCVVEIVHTASLILDDLPCMDDADQRRGAPALHRHVGEATAILAAFSLLARAQAFLPEALERAGVPPAHAEELQQRLAGAVMAMSRGQVQDLRLPAGAGDLEGLEAIHAQKTGALFVFAAELGGACAGLRGPRLDALLAYARNLGLAFQVGDDLLDAEGDAAQLGKQTGRDKTLARTTFVSVFGVDGARALRDELLAAARASLAPLGGRAALLSELAEHVRTRRA